MLFEHEDGVRVTTRRARIVKVDDSKSQQKVDIKGLKNEKPEKIWRPQDFGFSSNPPKDCDGVLVQMGSRSDRTLYMDGGHEKYRPKKTPVGGSVLFDHTGDIIRVFEKNLDVVHAKKVNIRVGHGYKAGDSGDSSSAGTGGGGGGGGDADSPDDESSKDEKKISIVLDGDAITLTYEGSTVTIEANGNVTAKAKSKFAGGVDGGRWVVARPGRVDLGVMSPDGMAEPQVMTTAGPSEIVYAVIA